MDHPKIDIEPLPVTEEFRRQKRLIQERGELALIEDGPAFHHLACFSLNPGQGLYRGGHYHETKVERFYVVQGELLVECHDMDDGQRFEVRLRAGDRAVVHPRLAHRFSAVESAWVIEYYEGTFDPDDDKPFHGW
ncbi:cupin domain-containing protein [Desulfohalovibrio reitneri]|uniref:cupin domain-containing protein n=1 Tax=Desulfohalovibrio reitneri TaxID=1307759 RepID=UPI0004A6FAF9|nr:cupin domain-containing protein [Desulfohalovibrio reitneri]